VAKKDALRRYADATARRLRFGATPENWAATREAIADHLCAYIRGEIASVDREIVVMLMSALGESSAKEMPALFTPLPKRRGESPNRASVAACLATAAEYIAFCKDHAPAPWVDAAPVTTVATAFGVATRTASRWKSHAPAQPSVGWDLTPQEVFALLASGMRAAAVLYARFGGASNAAVSARARADT